MYKIRPTAMALVSSDLTVIDINHEFEVYAGRAQEDVAMQAEGSGRLGSATRGAVRSRADFRIRSRHRLPRFDHRR
jgi:hypothetical protein